MNSVRPSHRNLTKILLPEGFWVHSYIGSWVYNFFRVCNANVILARDDSPGFEAVALDEFLTISIEPFCFVVVILRKLFVSVCFTMLVQPLVVPFMLEPKELRKKGIFRNLKSHWFSPTEIRFLCAEMNHEHDSWLYSRVSSRSLSRRYGINEAGLRSWFDKFQSGGEFMNSEPSVRPLLDGISLRIVAAKIRKLGANQDMGALIREQTNETTRRCSFKGANDQNL